MKRKISALLVALLLVLAPMTINAAENWYKPVRSSSISRGYSSSHKAIDFVPTTLNLEVRATKSGTIWGIFYGCKNVDGKTGVNCQYKGVCTPSDGFDRNVTHACNYGFGNGYIIKTDDGYYVGYAHMASTIYGRGSIGTRITQGQLIGYVGSSGNSTGMHLHLETHYNVPAATFSAWYNAPAYNITSFV